MISIKGYYVTLEISVGKAKLDGPTQTYVQGQTSYEFGPYEDYYAAKTKASDLANHIAARMGTLLLEGFEAE